MIRRPRGTMTLEHTMANYKLHLCTP